MYAIVIAADLLEGSVLANSNRPLVRGDEASRSPRKSASVRRKGMV